MWMIGKEIYDKVVIAKNSTICTRIAINHCRCTKLQDSFLRDDFTKKSDICAESQKNFTCGKNCNIIFYVAILRRNFLSRLFALCKHAHVTISQEKALHARYEKLAHTMNKMQCNEAGGATAHEGPSMGTVRRPGRGNEQMTHLWEAGRGSTSSWAR